MAMMRLLSVSSLALIVLLGMELQLHQHSGPAAMVDACGFPIQGPTTVCCGGGGGGCGCGRRKREASVGSAAVVQPHFKTEEVPCPQTAWRQIIEENLMEEDPATSVSAIQTAFYRRHGDAAKFLVTCAANKANEPAAVPGRVHLSSGGDGYCNVVRERLWCQVVSMSA